MKSLVQILCLCIGTWFSFTIGAHGQTIIKSQDLLEDFAIMKQSYQDLHPGLYRYQSPEEIAKAFDKLESKLQRDLSLGEAYLAFAQCLAEFECGHTYPNFWNQARLIKEELFNASDKLPFTFKLVEGAMLVEKDLTEFQLKSGTRIVSINDNPTHAIMDSILTVVQGDGSNDQSRLYECSLTGLGEYESFDVYFPLFFPPESGKYKVETNEGDRYTMTAISRSERLRRIEAEYGKQPTTYDDLWDYRIRDNGSAHLKLGTFVTWKMEMNWKKFISDAFEDMDKNAVQNLIIDIRGNGGGMTEVVEFVASYLISSPLEMNLPEERVAFEGVADNIDPYLNTWDNSFKNKKGRVKPGPNGQFIFKDAKNRTIKPKRTYRFTGKAYLVTDGSNSSATFIMADIFKRYSLTTLVGDETGGNLMGTNGGEMLFLKLPNSKIEMDIPLLGYYPVSGNPDRGVLPDITAPMTIQAFLNGTDPAFEAIDARIKQQD